VYADDFQFLYNSQLTLRSNYELDVLKLVLTTTQEEYGDFTIRTRESGYTISRAIQVALESPDVFLWASPYNPINTDLSVIEYPIFNGVFGFRSIVAHNDTLKSLNMVTTLDELKNFTIGQGPGWMDVDIYKHHGFKVVEARLDKLFNMAANKRFDLLPLGRLEISDGILLTKKGGDKLSIAPKHMIYYPHPVLFHLNKKHTKAINRLNDGMEKITKNGSLSVLFSQHFPRISAQIKQQNLTVIKLENNTLPANFLERVKGSKFLKHINFVE
jgi:hypothetical protein